MAAGTERALAYWRANIKLMAVLLAIWFVVSFGFGILFVDALNNIRLMLVERASLREERTAEMLSVLGHRRTGPDHHA